MRNRLTLLLLILSALCVGAAHAATHDVDQFYRHAFSSIADESAGPISLAPGIYVVHAGGDFGTGSCDLEFSFDDKVTWTVSAVAALENVAAEVIAEVRVGQGHYRFTCSGGAVSVFFRIAYAGGAGAAPRLPV